MLADFFAAIPVPCPFRGPLRQAEWRRCVGQYAPRQIPPSPTKDIKDERQESRALLLGGDFCRKKMTDADPLFLFRSRIRVTVARHCRLFAWLRRFRVAGRGVLKNPLLADTGDRSCPRGRGLRTPSRTVHGQIALAIRAERHEKRIFEALNRPSVPAGATFIRFPPVCSKARSDAINQR